MPGPDFKGDGYADLAAGVPGEAQDEPEQGAVSVIYGSGGGLSAHRNQLWSQNSPGVLDVADPGERFGEALAWADFDGDGYDDLAIAVPYEQVGRKTSAGAVNVLYGSASGLTSDGDQFWTQSSPGLPGQAGKDHSFGDALLGRDFDLDGFGDLVIGAPGDVASDRSGSALVLRGGPSGLGSAGSQELVQPQHGPTAGDGLGHSFAAGDFDDNGFPDLAIGVPYEDVNGLEDNGAVEVFYGSVRGFTEAANQLWHQASPGVPGDPDSNEHLGWSLSAADFNGDQVADLAIGIADDSVGAADGAGSALVLDGARGGLTATGSELWSQSPEVCSTKPSPATATPTWWAVTSTETASRTWRSDLAARASATCRGRER